MTDYSLAYKIEKVADAISKVARAMDEANRMELAKQRREWLQQGNSKESF